MAVRLFVGNLPFNASEAALREHFSSIGPISYIYMPVDRVSGKPRGFAFVEFGVRAQAEEAIRRFNNSMFMGRPLSINEARERDERPRSVPVSQSSPGRLLEEAPASRERAGRSFGPDATPRRSRKPGRGSKSERGPKQPIRQRPGGQFFGSDDDDRYDDDLNGENFASRVTDEESA